LRSLIIIEEVMVNAVYHRGYDVREIGTIAAIGTLPGKILSMFVIEGFCMGVAGVLIGDLVGISLVYILNLSKISYDFGQQKGIILHDAASHLTLLPLLLKRQNGPDAQRPASYCRPSCIPSNYFSF